MPTTRRRRRRALLAPRIPEAAVVAYRLATKGYATYDACTSGEACEGNDRRHCAVCAEHIEARKALRTALGTKPWEPCPLDVDAPEPATIYGPGLLWWQGWPKAWAQRVALEGAADGD